MSSLQKQEKQSNANINRLWDLETVGICSNDEAQELLVDNIVFNGSRYSVSLPWKAGHGSVPSNYNTCIARLKSQV